MFTKLKKSHLQKQDQGFTIIEVMIVLAIAGLILLIVFLAVPALQRNSRNTQRKNDASHVSSLITEWESNNGGKTPTAFGTGGGTKIDITGESFSIINTPTLTTVPATIPSTPPAADDVTVYSKATCNGNTPVAATSARSIAVWYGLEGSTTAGCIST